jgi:hypothetical protein
LKSISTGEHYDVYCHMTDIETCGGGGWTHVMKLDGNKVRPHKKNSWLASSPAHKKGPAQDFFYFLFKKTPTFMDQRALVYVVFLLTVVNCVNKFRNCVRK